MSVLALITGLGFELGAGTAVPLAVGVDATIHVTDRVQLGASVGWMPPPYVDLINATVVAFDGYDEDTAALIAAALDSAWLGRVSIGVRPFRYPLAFHAGYSLAALGGGLAEVVQIEAVTGHALRADVSADEVQLDSRVHLVQVGATWRFDLRDDLVLVASVEYTQPIAAHSALVVPTRSPMQAMRVDRVSAALDGYLEDVFTSYVKAPVVGVSLRWRR